MLRSTTSSEDGAAPWREPTSRLPLHWGTYLGRYLAGIVLVVGGGIHLLGSNNWTLWFLLVGTIAHVVGWSILPARGWRRVLAAGPAVAAVWIMLAGPQALWALTIPYACWLLVRHRPLRSYVTVLFPLAAGIALAPYFVELSGMPLALTIAMAVVVASAWIARLIAQGARIPGESSARVR